MEELAGAACLSFREAHANSSRRCAVLCNGCQRDARYVLSRLDQLGLVVVPREPSEATVAAGCICVGPDIAEAIYLAMINAALSDPREAGLPKIPVLRIEGLDE